MTVAAPGFVNLDSKSRTMMRWFWPVLASLLLLRLAIDGSLVLLPDEAVYWSWSRHLSLGYLDHPPLIAWLNWVSTGLLGSTEFAVRLPITLLAYASIAVIIGPLGRNLTRSGDGYAMLAIIWLTSPMLFGFATVATPDTPVFFFSACALACVVKIAWIDEQRSPSSTPGPVDPDTFGTPRSGSPSLDVKTQAACWLFFGVFTGLGLLSKYTAVLVPVAVGFWLASSQVGRVHLRQPWIYLSALVALIIFSPVIYWNQQHGWASFAFQLHHGMSGEGGAATAPQASHTLLVMVMHAGGFVAGQALLWTPVLFVLGMIALARGWVSFSRVGQIDRLLLWSATVPLGLFFVAWVRKPGEINWPSFAYVPLSILMVRRAGDAYNGAWAGWIWQGCKVAVAFAIGLHLLLLPQAAKLIARLHFKPPHNVTDLHAPWPEMGALIASRAKGALLVCNRHQDAGEIAFYVPGQPNVWCDGVGFRVTAFDYFDSPPLFDEVSRVMFIGGHALEFEEKHHYQPVAPEILKEGADARLSRPAVLLTRSAGSAVPTRAIAPASIIPSPNP